MTDRSKDDTLKIDSPLLSFEDGGLAIYKSEQDPDKEPPFIFLSASIVKQGLQRSFFNRRWRNSDGVTVARQIMCGQPSLWDRFKRWML